MRFSLLFNGLINQPTFIGYDQLFDCLVGFFEFVRHLYVVHLSLKRLSMRRRRFLPRLQKTSYCFHVSDAEYKTSVKLLLKGNFFFRYVVVALGIVFLVVYYNFWLIFFFLLPFEICLFSKKYFYFNGSAGVCTIITHKKVGKKLTQNLT